MMPASNGIKFRPLNVIVYLADFGGKLDAAANHYAALQFASDHGLVIGAYRNDEPVGAAMLTANESRLDLSYLTTIPEYRNQGIGRMLFAECLRRAQDGGYKFFQTWLNGGIASSFDDGLRELGFARRAPLKTTVIPLPRVRGEWDSFTHHRGGAKIAQLETRGYQTLRYADTPPETLQYIFDHIGTEFPGNLDPRTAESPIMPDHSFIAIRAGKPVAFCIITSADGGKSAILEQLSTSQTDRGSGAFLMCVIAAVNSLYAAGIEKLAWAHSPSNETLPDIVTGPDWFPEKTVTKNYCYFKEFPQNEVPQQHERKSQNDR